MKQQKFVLDTNVILDDVYNIIVLSQNNTNKIYIPYTVLQEMESKKTLLTEVGYQARKFNRFLAESKTTSYKSNKEYSLNKVKGIINGDPIELFTYFSNLDTKFELNDDAIIDCAKMLKGILITEDASCHNKAISKRIKCEYLKRYQKDSLEDDDSLIIKIEITAEQAQRIDELQPSDFDLTLSNFTNVEFVVSEEDRSILAFWKNNEFYVLDEKMLRKLLVKPKNKEQLYFLNMLLDKEVPIIVASGTSGSGKNLLSIVAALESKMPIKYARNTVTAGDKESQVGFLKGDENTKIGVFAYPLTDSIDMYLDLKKEKEMKKKEPVQVLDKKTFMEDNNISVININQMRGSNQKGFLILDEWQNSTTSVNKLMLTRIVEGSRVVIIGDQKQIDHPILNKYNNALSIMLKQAKSSDMVAGIKLKKVLRGKIAEYADSL